jgi:hypothetical protein
VLSLELQYQNSVILINDKKWNKKCLIVDNQHATAQILWLLKDECNMIWYDMILLYYYTVDGPWQRQNDALSR